MGTKKDIAQAFKEQLSGYKASPDNLIWEQLEINLKSKKKKRRIFLLWLYVAGTGAIILLLLFWMNKESFTSTLKMNPSKPEILDSQVHRNDSVQNNSNTNTISPSEKLQGQTETSTDASSSQNESISNETLEHNQNTKVKTSNKEVTTPIYTNKKNNSKGKKTNQKQIAGNSKDANHSINSKNKLNNKNATTSNVQKEKDTLSAKEQVSFKNSSFVENVELPETLMDSLEEKRTSLLGKEIDDLDKNKKNKDSIIPPQLSKWSVFPNASLIYYDGFGRSFNDQISLNYGLYFTYLPSNQVSFRLGVNKLNLKQSSLFSTNSKEEQEVSYLEIPLEIKYAIIDKKIRVSSIGGLSYLLLEGATLIKTLDSSVLVRDNKSDFTKSNITFNVGFEVQTKLFDKFYFNFEPMFKYHFSPYSANTDFNPFAISITSGLEYKF